MSKPSPSDLRPKPEALLRAAALEGRGRLKVFLGAAPGVGKTFEMLSEGAERGRSGVDVVIGVVETHGRHDTEALTRDLEIIPRRQVEYQGHQLSEMDLDAILARRPQLVLVDELAHTNAPGSRHPKRWQDIDELLGAGIDVYSTVNIQHLESLNDVVASFTKVRVRETVPDKVLESAEVEVVDIPPDELIERLKEGKVYIPDEATRALNHFFSKSNLSALREMALRTAAQTVDAQMLDYLRAHAMSGTFAAGERVLVGVSEQPGGESLIRAAKRLADALHAPWSAVHVETPRDAQFSDQARERLASNLGLAASLGAIIVSVPAQTVFRGLMEQLRESRATQLVVGKSQRSWWFELRHGSVVDRIVRESEGVAVHVLPESVEPSATRRQRGSFRRRGRKRDYLVALGGVALLTAVGKLVEPWLGYQSIDLLYFLPTIAAATALGLRPGILAGIASGLAYNFFFIPPLFTFTIYDPQNVITFVILTIVAVLTSQLAGRVRAQAELGARSARENAALAGFARALAALSEEKETAQAVCAEVARILDVTAMVLSKGEQGIEVVAGFPPDVRLGTIDTVAAEWAFDKGEAAGRGTNTLSASEWRFHPLQTALGTLAVLGVSRSDAGDPVPPHRAVLFMSLVDQAALAHERLRLEEDMREIHTLKERDELRSALLSSLAHDLRTPLTAVTAGVEAIEDGEASPEVLRMVRAEAKRLQRFFENLIDVTRVEAGAIVPRLEATDLTDAVASAVQDVHKAREERRIILNVPPTLPLVRTDPTLLHHILINLIDNAAKFSAAGSEIIISAERDPDGICLNVLDEGPGLPLGRTQVMFETFTRVEGSDRSGGTGLGLAIVKGFANSLGLNVEASNRADKTGARFSVRFPNDLVIRSAEGSA